MGAAVGSSGQYGNAGQTYGRGWARGGRGRGYGSAGQLRPVNTTQVTETEEAPTDEYADYEVQYDEQLYDDPAGTGNE